ncbi:MULTISPECIES: hypothetical protein [unclassified Streptomyces]|uniref:hypothetical protein n=1 Tax=unclassified Streptomyces TaxID=2593676 RepID=UPI000DC7B1A6|nr:MULTISPECIES: hypothetical protein [unclassified Streptomyces]AWZ06873.1 hypothetical protein DRB89_22160 [Streptomyces sp. ICC4]AWZ14548.1 hypothetical protein DRB96_22370 [Streptomyces sp. ICC1]
MIRSALRLTRTPAIERLALFGALLATFDAVHGFCDHWGQDSTVARCKRLYGQHSVYADGTTVQEGDGRTGEATTTASTRGRIAASRHAAEYTAIQTSAALALTRALGYRIGPGALLAGAVINGVTHAVIDRGALFLWIADRTGRRGYIDHCQTVRLDPDGSVHAEANGPGTAWMELDESLHRIIGVSAAAVTVLLTTHRGDQR